MFLAEVVGTVVSPVQIPVLDGHKLLLLRPVGPDGKPCDAVILAVIDSWDLGGRNVYEKWA